jgi:two-component system, OmpR family, response regulator VanR
MSQQPLELPKVHDLDEMMRLDGDKRVLIIDDDMNTTDVLKLYLENEGYQVEIASDGVQGVKKVMSSDFSVVLCDMVMPNLSGEMFYVAVERVKPHLCKRFIFMTGHQQDVKINAFIRRINGLMILKPFQLHKIFEAVQSVQNK